MSFFDLENRAFLLSESKLSRLYGVMLYVHDDIDGWCRICDDNRRLRSHRRYVKHRLGLLRILINIKE